MPKPKAEARYRFLGVLDDSDERSPLGTDANALFPGEEVVVREVVDAGEPGAHDDSEDSVVVEWQVPDRVRGENGWERGTSPRAVSIGLASFADMFEEA